MYDIITANIVKRPFCEYSVAAWKLSCGGGKMRPSHLPPNQIFDYACMDAETLYQKLGVSPAGLSQEEAEKSRAQHGKTAARAKERYRASPAVKSFCQSLCCDSAGAGQHLPCEGWV